MNYTQPQIDRANAVSLEDFLRTQGETISMMSCRESFPLSLWTCVIRCCASPVRWMRKLRQVTEILPWQSELRQLSIWH